MNKPRICGVITEADAKALEEVEPLVDLFEVRIDLLGDAWRNVVKTITKPWIACNRLAAEGGEWRDSEARRIERLLQAIELGADTVDVELRTHNLDNVVAAVKRRARCLISSHDLEKTPSLDELKSIVAHQVKAGADIGKVVTTARTTDDNLTVLRLLKERPGIRLVSFAMGPAGIVSRVLSPLAGADFTYAAVASGKESAASQMTVAQLKDIYRMLGV